ncbi:hypothetical protein HK098_000429 [Nowakowskiella sp. JEL0407]|nr:hypothetical protein HK098_000429 [Nowakowskiella sp. JEL0407]
MLAQVFSGLRLIIFYKLNSLKVDQMVHRSLEQLEPGYHQKEEFLLKYRHYFTDKMFTGLMGLVLVGMLVFNLVVQGTLGWWDKFPEGEDGNVCPSQSMFKIPLYIIRGLIFYVVNPVLVYFSRNVEDGYGIRKQIIVSQSAAGMLNIMAMVWEYAVIPNYKVVVTTGELWTMALVDFQFFVMIPVIRAGKLTAQYKNLRSITNPKLSPLASTSSTSSNSTDSNSENTVDLLKLLQTHAPTTHQITIFQLITASRKSIHAKPNWNPENSMKSYRKVLECGYYRSAMVEFSARLFAPEEPMFLYAYIVLWQFTIMRCDELVIRKNSLTPIGGNKSGGGEGEKKILMPWNNGFSMPDVKVPEEYQGLYIDVYKNFLAGSGDFSLNVTYKSRQAVEVAIQSRNFKMNVFDAVYLEVFELVRIAS